MNPLPITDLQAAFPTHVTELMPIQDERWKEYRRGGKSWGFRLFADWFYKGLTSLEIVPKEGIDEKAAIRHIRTIMGSYEPKHEDKTAACALLFEKWFESAKWEAKK